MLQCEWCSNKFRSHDTYQRHVDKFHSAQAVDIGGSDGVKGAGGAFGLDEVDHMTEISLTEFLSQYNTDQLSDVLPFP